MKKHPALIGIIFTVFLSLFMMAKADLASARADSKQKTAFLYGKLEGFKPGAKVSYRVFPEQGRQAAGETYINAQGALSLPAYNLYDAAGSELSYIFEIDEGPQRTPLNIGLNMRADNGKIVLNGKGLPQFSHVQIKNNHQLKKARADWAGLIKETNIGTLSEMEKKGGVQLAFYDSNMMNDVTTQNPKIIEVLAAPGGGTPNPPINMYSTPYGCMDPLNEVTFSFCDFPVLDQQIKNIVDNYVPPLILMTDQFAHVMAMQIYAVGQMFDAKFQLESQREIQALVAEAHKDYQPSELMCQFGSFVKGITNADEKTDYEQLALNDVLMTRYSNIQHTGSGEEGFVSDASARIRQFREVYCDVEDNNSGLHYLCDYDQAPDTTGAGGTDKKRLNKDIDYSRTLDSPLTLDFDLAYAHRPGITTAPSSADEEDIIALARNLYWPTALNLTHPEKIKQSFDKYLNVRHLFATTNVAHNSLAAIVGLKSKAPPIQSESGAAVLSGANYMQSLMRDFGMSDSDINDFLGRDPSYYAQMEVLTKKIYQQPDFYTSLYDKPANVKRINATMQAIQIKQARDAFESALRRELLTSLMVEEALTEHIDRLNGSVVSEIRNLSRP